MFTLDTRLAAEQAEDQVREQFRKIEEIEQKNTQKVMQAFWDHRVSQATMYGTTGYGHDDKARDTLDALWAQVLGAEDALVRHNFSSGTNTLATALFAVLRPGDTMLAVTGRPYDTLLQTIGLSGTPGNGSLADFGVKYREINLLEDFSPDYDAIEKALQTDPSVKMVYVQRSRGYTTRPALTIDVIEKIVRTVNKRAIVMVDNCYGEFTELREPTEVGADLIAGSMIKNAGGGIALTGGYIAGRADLVEKAAYRLTAVGLGKDCTPSLDQMRPLTMGLFMAPHTVAEAMKCAVFAAKLFENAGFETTPSYDAKRSDIVQTVTFRDPKKLVRFCQGIQKGSPVDSYVYPEPYIEDGYDDQVIMAAGTFVSGASIEISADGPMRDPFVGYLQGGLTYSSGKLAIMTAYEEMMKE
ncbi:MAG: aminotransferase class I/II-fold pyridoxal phosphate-dependent enzyme [Clostridia bacterium]|nr:aminotransferase class I/II-fold pyridoxal phosphate-dependent enzyme [Clostridia bacterium]